MSKKTLVDAVKKHIKPGMKLPMILAVLINFLLFISAFIKARGISGAILSASEGKPGSVLSTSLVLLSALMFIYLLKTGISMIRNNHLSVLQHEYKSKLQERIIAQKLSDLSTAETGAALENLNDDLSTVTQFYSDTIPGFICSVIQMILYGVYLGMMSYVIIIVLLIIACIQVIPPIIVQKYMEKYYGETREIEAQVTEEIVQVYNGIAEIKRNHAVSKVASRFYHLHEKVYKIDKKNQFLLQLETAMDTLIDNALTYGTYAILGLFAVIGLVSVDTALQAILLSASFYASFNQIFKVIPQAGIFKIAVKRLSVWFNEDEKKVESIYLHNRIEFQDFSYQYPNAEKKIFSNLTFTFRTDEISIIVGKNGTGKSTLLKQLTGWLSAGQGEISFCGMNPDCWDDNTRDKYVFYLPQADPCFHISAVALFEEFSKERAEACIVNAERFGLSDEQLHTQISNLSGGERKKVFLSLAFSTDSEVFLLLDEPTNSLDQEGIEVLISLLKQRCGGLLITHNPKMLSLPYSIYEISDKGTISKHEKELS